MKNKSISKEELHKQFLRTYDSDDSEEEDFEKSIEKQNKMKNQVDESSSDNTNKGIVVLKDPEEIQTMDVQRIEEKRKFKLLGI